MKLHILSDLHTEFADFVPPETDAEAVILAGDIGVGVEGVRWAARHYPVRPVIYVPGNHNHIYLRHADARNRAVTIKVQCRIAESSVPTIVRTPAGKWNAVVRKVGWTTQCRTIRLKTDATGWARCVDVEMVQGTFVDPRVRSDIE